MPITEQQLLQILPNAGRNAGVFASALNLAMDRYQINTRLRMAAFIAQVGHESGQLTSLVENLNYSAEGLMKTWPSRFDLVRATAAARKPEQIANIVYAGRMGNTEPGDGWKYRGRGLFQVTGRANYTACGEALGLDLINNPQLLEQPQYAAMSATWFWSTRGLNTLADQGQFVKITRRINGGLTGQDDRQALYDKALKVLA
ncbi:glycoside hydrolase family 19 protein [Pseudomonas gorinensis]